MILLSILNLLRDEAEKSRPDRALFQAPLFSAVITYDLCFDTMTAYFRNALGLVHEAVVEF